MNQSKNRSYSTRSFAGSRRTQSRSTSKTKSRYYHSPNPLFRNLNNQPKFQRRGRKTSQFDVERYIRDNPVIKNTVQEEQYVPKNEFADFTLSRNLTSSLNQTHYTIPTPIQDQIIPYILEGKDVVGLANTGTGKTAAFLIPLIDKVLQNTHESIIILAPTRELVIQIEQELKALSGGLRISSAICVGGMSINQQVRTLRRHTHIIIGTPGRVKDLIQRRCIVPSSIRTVVLDEADRMLDMGFIHDMRSILSRFPDKRQTLFFSATMSREIEGIVHEFLQNPVTISVKKQDAAQNIKQEVIKYGRKDRIDVLTELLKKDELTKVIVFGRTKYGMEKLCKKLIQRGIKAVSIHGNKSHGQRQQALTAFKRSQVKALIATDVAARGIHVDDVSHVINYDLPGSQDDYIHRIGRTGRVDRLGRAITLVQ